MRPGAVPRQKVRQSYGAHSDLLDRLDHDHLVQSVDPEHQAYVAPWAFRRPLDEPREAIAPLAENDIAVAQTGANLREGLRRHRLEHIGWDAHRHPFHCAGAAAAGSARQRWG
jgi:hypothetical protein